MTLLAILIATLAAGIGSVWLADRLMHLGLHQGSRVGPQHLLSLAAGALLATAFLHLLPEAFESPLAPQTLFACLLAGLVFFFLLDKAELWHHGHEHHQGLAAHPHGHEHHHAHHHEQSPAAGSWAVLTGDSVHCFGDGVLIASAFLADWQLGLAAALAVLAHEVPHHMGDLAVLRQGAVGGSMALVKLSLAGAVTALGGLLGYFLLSRLHDWVPLFLVLASSSFIYVALADLIPQLQKRLSARQTAAQIVWLGAGIALVLLVGRWASGLAH